MMREGERRVSLSCQAVARQSKREPDVLAKPRTLFVFPDLIAFAAGNKHLSRFLECVNVLVVGDDFHAELLILPYTVVLTNPCYVSKHSGKRGGNNLLFSRCAFHHRCNFLGPRKGF